MTKTVFQLFLLALVLILVQVICSKIVLFNVATPIIFIYLIIHLPLNTTPNWAITTGFVLGLVIDVFNNTQGMNALCCTLLGAMRRPMLNAYLSREEEMTNPFPTITSLGTATFLKYMGTMVVVYCFMLFMIQAFSLHNFTLTLMRIGASSLLSIILIYAIDSLISTRREKRL